VTEIVGYKVGGHVYMGCDGRATYGDMYIDNSTGKIAIIKNVDGVEGNILIGTSGYNYHRNLLELLELPKRPSSYSPYAYVVKLMAPAIRQLLLENSGNISSNGMIDTHGEWLIAIESELYLLGCDTSIIDIVQYHAIGSGSHLALGVMSYQLRKNTTDTVADFLFDAMIEACAHSTSCNYPLIIRDTASDMEMVLTKPTEQPTITYNAPTQKRRNGLLTLLSGGDNLT